MMPLEYYDEVARVLLECFKKVKRKPKNLINLLQAFVGLNLNTPDIEKIKHKLFKYSYQHTEEQQNFFN
jgi:hypothetical protein